MCPAPFQRLCFCLSPSLFGAVVVNSVCCQTPWGGLGQHCCGQLSRCGLETMDVLGGNDAMEQLLKKRTVLSKSTISLFLPWIENEGKNPQNIKTCWAPQKYFGLQLQNTICLVFCLYGIERSKNVCRWHSTASAIVFFQAKITSTLWEEGALLSQAALLPPLC